MKKDLKTMIQQHISERMKYIEENKDKITQEREESCKKNKTCLSFWFPIVSKIPGVLTPKTFIYPIHFEDQLDFIDNKNNPNVKKTIALIRSQAEILGFPVFIKNSLFSGKHSWLYCCYVDSAEKLLSHFRNLTDQSYGVGCAECMFWVLREYIKPKFTFTAHEGMPVTKERRYFVENGKVVFHHPYWPPKSVQNASTPDWESQLAILNEESPPEISYLKELSEKVGVALGGSWSVDWMQAESGEWFLIDMAEAHKSFKWKDYPLGTIGL
jgi:hypothetical protein